MGLSNLPPGVTDRMIEEQCRGGPCECCGHDCDDCICPECPKCGEVGNPNCYKKHGLKKNVAQLMGISKMRVAALEDQICDEGQYQNWLEQQPEDYTE